MTYNYDGPCLIGFPLRQKIQNPTVFWKHFIAPHTDTKDRVNDACLIVGELILPCYEGMFSVKERKICFLILTI